MDICVIGFGFVGTAVYENLKKRGNTMYIYDKFQEEHSDPEVINKSSICFVCVPTPASDNGYDTSALEDVFSVLDRLDYNGIIVNKCTVLPGTTAKLIDNYSNLKITYNPEFLTAKTATDDFDKQKHIVIGYENSSYGRTVKEFFRSNFPDAEISSCSTLEAESIKIFCNTFYAVKVQTFTEFKLMCDSTGANYNTIKDLMLRNGWINPMHTQVPGPDGKVSFGGMCFPKDLTALTHYMKNNNLDCDVLDAALAERNKMRD